MSLGLPNGPRAMRVESKNMNQLEAIRATKGKIFTARFIKKDGSVRVMNARTGVRKGVKGIGLKFSPENKGLATVFDVSKKEHRFINLRTLQSVDCGKLQWRA